MFADIAEVYDQIMDEVNYKDWSDYLFRLFLNAPIEIKNVLEFGCGTGNITELLAKKDYNITAVDTSEDMLTIADEKLNSQGEKVRFFLGDMANFSINEKFDAVISVFDSVNYLLTLEDLYNFVEGAYDVLEDGGILLFDVITTDYIKNASSRGQNTTDEGNLFYNWQLTEGERANSLKHKLTIFKEDEDGRYTRIDEEQEQQAFSSGDIYNLLKQVGFVDIKIYSFGSFLAGTDESERLQIYAQKPKS